MVRHKWEKIETKEYDLETHQCKICGCIRHKFIEPGMPYPGFSYVRNGIIFSEGRPDCYTDADDFGPAMGFFNT